MENDTHDNDDNKSSACPPPLGLERQSSFAREFFQAGATHEGLQFTTTDDDEQLPTSAYQSTESTAAMPAMTRPLHSAATSLPQSQQRRSPSFARFHHRRSVTTSDLRRDCSNGITITHHYDDESKSRAQKYYAPTEPPPAAASTATDTHTSTAQQPTERQGHENGGVERRASWVRDALEGGLSPEDLLAILGTDAFMEDAKSPLPPPPPPHEQQQSESNKDDELSEQYRVESQLQAHRLLREKTGMEVDVFLQSSDSRAVQQNRSFRSIVPRRRRLHPDFYQVPASLDNDNDDIGVNIALPTPLSPAAVLINTQLPPIDVLSQIVVPSRDSVATLGRRDTDDERATCRCVHCKKLLQFLPLVTWVVCPACRVEFPNKVTKS